MESAGDTGDRGALRVTNAGDKNFPLYLCGWHGWQTYIFREREIIWISSKYIRLSPLSPSKIEGEIFVTFICHLQGTPVTRVTLRFHDLAEILMLFWILPFCFISVCAFLTRRAPTGRFWISPFCFISVWAFLAHRAPTDRFWILPFCFISVWAFFGSSIRPFSIFT